MIEAIFWIGRILLGGFLLMMGLNHFTKMDDMVGYAKSKDIPLPDVGVVLTGGILILSGLGILFWYFVEIALILVAVFLISTTVLMHRFWENSDPQTQMKEKMHLMNNMGILGLVFLVLAFLV